MAITDITKPMALDETLQATNGKMDSVITKLQGIIDALGLDTSVYKPKGNITCAALVPALLIDDNLGNVYNVTDNGTTTSDFVEGAGKPIHVGDNVAIVDIGTGGQSEYKFDLLAGMVDLTNYVQKSDTPGLLKNDGTIDTKDYAEKVAGATSGNLAGLNGSGNLTDIGWNGAKDTTSISGNPISISGLKANQLAKNPIITLEPIQAGSGTPSPSNIRAISGYDKVEVESCGKNLCDNSKNVSGGYYDTTGWKTESSYATSDLIPVKPNTIYSGSLFSKAGQRINNVVYTLWSDENTCYQQVTSSPVTTDSNTKYIRIRNFVADASYITGNNYLYQLEEGSTASTTFYPYNKATSISESLGQTVYWLTHTVRTGIAKILGQLLVNPQNLDWHEGSRNVFYAALTSGVGNGWSSHYAFSNIPYQTMDDLTWYTQNNYIYVRNTNYGGNVSGFAASLNDVQFVYPLATPTEIQLTPHEISLLKDNAYVSTNGTNIALDYHNGEIASLADVNVVGQSLNALGEYINTPNAKSIGDWFQIGKLVFVFGQYNVSYSSTGNVKILENLPKYSTTVYGSNPPSFRQRVNQAYNVYDTVLSVVNESNGKAKIEGMAYNSSGMVSVLATTQFSIIYLTD